MELVNYFRIVRRRWRLVALFVILGACAGVASSVFGGGSVKAPGTTYYLAKHTLSTSNSTANLSRDAALCTEGEVPKRVAAKLNFDNPTVLAGRITCEPHPETKLLYVAAADLDQKRSALLADSFAEELVGYLRDVAEQDKQAEVQRIDNEIEAAKSEFTRVQDDEKNTSDATQKKLDQQRETDLAKSINDLSNQKNAALAKPAETETLTTLSTADPVPISQNAYDLLLNGDTSKNAQKGNSPTQAATRQSQIDAAIKAGNPITLPSRLALGCAAGLLLGFTAAIVLDRIDPRLRTKFEAEEAFGWPVIGEIPPLTRRERQQLTVFAYDEPRSRAAEAYRVLRSAVLFSQMGDDLLDGDDVHPIFAPPPRGVALDADDDRRDGTHGDDTKDLDTTSDDADRRPVGDGASVTTVEGTRGEADRPALSGPPADKTRGQVIMVTSPGPSEGKTTTAANLAAILAETGRSVLVVNCDFRRPRIHLYLDAPNEPRQVVDTKLANVKLVSQVLENPNEANPAMVLQTQRQVIRNAREMFDIVLLDTAPLLTTNDATDVLSVADQVVIVAKSGKTHKEAADRAAELLERRKGPVLGVILVGATDVPTSRYYYYGDNPEADEPEPGTETESPFEALVDPAPPGSHRHDEAHAPGDDVFAKAMVPGDAAAATTESAATTATTATTGVDPSPTASDATPAGNGSGSNGSNGSKRSRRSKKADGSDDGTPDSLRGR